MSSRIGLYAGSFDPVTLGHLDIIRRGARLVDKLIVSVGINPDKRPLFSPAERVQMLQTVLKEIPNVEVDCFEGLTVDHVHRRQAGVMIRGIRTVSDIESEFTMALTNRTLSPEIETVFLMASEKFSHISSSLIKQIAFMGKDHSLNHLEQFVPKEVIPLLMAKARN